MSENDEQLDGLRAAAVILQRDEILLMHRFYDGREYYVFPGGGVEEGELPEDAAIRELKEEFNIDIKREDELWQVVNTAYGKTRREYYYLVKEFTGDIQIGGEELEWMKEDPTNVFEPMWVNLSELNSIVLYPKSAKEKLQEYIAMNK